MLDAVNTGRSNELAARPDSPRDFPVPAIADIGTLTRVEPYPPAIGTSGFRLDRVRLHQQDSLRLAPIP